MLSEKGVNFSLKSAKSDEWYTPTQAIYPILEYIDNKKIIWCPFDTEESNFVKVLKNNGYTVINSHIDDGLDFFEYEPDNWDIILSNPPYSKRNEILKRAFGFNKPFALLMNTNGLFDSRVRWNLFNEFNDFSLFYLKGRVNYMKEYGKTEKSSPPFQSAYITSGIFSEKIVFEKINKKLYFNNTTKIYVDKED